jgi:hypothetical protein
MVVTVVVLLLTDFDDASLQWWRYAILPWIEGSCNKDAPLAEGPVDNVT